MEITFLSHTPTTVETEAYRRHAMSRYPTAVRVLVAILLRMKGEGGE